MRDVTISERRRAERFAQLLDEANGGRRHHTRSPADEALTKLVEVGKRLDPVGMAAAPDSRFRRDLRAMLVATAERDGIGLTAHPEPEPGRWAPVGTRLRARGAIVVGISIGALALSGVSVASGSAVPGDALYGMKRSTEQTRLALTGSGLSRAQLHLEFARTRLQEAQQVRGDAADLAKALDDMDEDIRHGVRMLIGAAWHRQNPAMLDTVDSFAGDQRRRVGELSKLTGGDTHDKIAASLALLDSVRERSDAIRAALACDADTVGADALGPVPGRCMTATSSSATKPKTTSPNMAAERGQTVSLGPHSVATAP